MDETGKAILDIENKKKTIAHASNSEQEVIKIKIKNEFTQIGEKAYTMYSESNFDIEKLTDIFATVSEHYRVLEEKKAKLSEILSRYDDELAILTPKGQMFCTGCGKPYIQDRDNFCTGCGNKL